MLQRSYFKDDAPVIFPSPATFLQRCHGYIKGFPVVTVGKTSIPLTVSLLEKQRRSKNTCSEQLLDAAKTVVQLHHMTLYFQSSLLLPTSAVPPQKRKSAALTSRPDRGTRSQPRRNERGSVTGGRQPLPSGSAPVNAGSEWVVVLIFPPFLSTLLREAEEASGTEVRGQSEVLRPQLAAQRAPSCYFPACNSASRY